MTYKIKFESNGETYEYIRNADSADEAAKILAREFGLFAKVDLIDADTRGEEWAQVYYFADSGSSRPIAVAMADKSTEHSNYDEDEDEDEEDTISWREATSVFHELQHPSCHAYRSDNGRVAFVLVDGCELFAAYIDGKTLVEGDLTGDNGSEEIWAQIVDAAFGDEADAMRKFEKSDKYVAIWNICSVGCAECPCHDWCGNMDEIVGE